MPNNTRRNNKREAELFQNVLGLTGEVGYKNSFRIGKRLSKRSAANYFTQSRRNRNAQTVKINKFPSLIHRLATENLTNAEQNRLIAQAKESVELGARINMNIIGKVWTTQSPLYERILHEIPDIRLEAQGSQDELRDFLREEILYLEDDIETAHSQKETKAIRGKIRTLEERMTRLR